MSQSSSTATRSRPRRFVAARVQRPRMRGRLRIEQVEQRMAFVHARQHRRRRIAAAHEREMARAPYRDTRSRGIVPRAAARRRVRRATRVRAGNGSGRRSCRSSARDARQTPSARAARHRAVVVHHLADHRRGREARERREIAAGLGVPARTSTPPGRAAIGNTWPGCTRSSGRAPARTAARIVCAIGRRNAGRHAVGRLDADGERGAERRAVVIGHRRQPAARSARRSA